MTPDQPLDAPKALPPFQTVWRGLPDPRDNAAPGGATCDIDVNQSAYRHFAKHLAKPNEPWPEILSPEQIQLFGQLIERSPQPAERPALEKALALLEEQARRSLHRPLAVLYDAVASQTRTRRPHAWMLVAPLGFTLVVRSRSGGRPKVTTCFFCNAARSEPDNQRRWRRAARSLIERYAWCDSKQGMLRPPPEGDPGITVRTEHGVERRINIRFVLLEQWGFQSTRGSQGSHNNSTERFWSGRLGNWEGTVEKPGAPVIRLRPRRSSNPS